MSVDAGLYLVGLRGYRVLSSLLETIGPSSIRFIAAGQDDGVEDDYFGTNSKLAARHNLDFYSRANLNPQVAGDS